MSEREIRAALDLELAQVPPGVRQRVLDGVSDGGHEPARWHPAGIVAAITCGLLVVAALLGIRLASAARTSQAHNTPTPAGSSVSFPRFVSAADNGWGTVWVTGTDTGTNGHQRLYRLVNGSRWIPDLDLGVGTVLFMHEFDGQEGLLLWQDNTGSGTLFATHNGGRRWESHTVPLPGRVDSCTFSDPSTGWCVFETSGPKAVWWTADGGLTWLHSSDLPASMGVVRLSFSDGLNGWASPTLLNGARNVVLYRTRDGGRTWSPTSLPAPAVGLPGLYAGVGAMTFPDRSSLAVVLRVQEGSMGVGAPMTLFAYSSQDGGQSWSAPTTLWSGKSALEGFPVAASTAPDRWVLLIGNRAQFSSDGGRTWTPVVLPIGSDYFVTSLASGLMPGLVATANPHDCAGTPCTILLRSERLGQSWVVAATSMPYGTRNTPGPKPS